MPVKAISSIGRLQVVADGEGLTSRAGTALVAGVPDQVGLTAGLSAALEGLRKRRSGHDRGRVAPENERGIAATNSRLAISGRAWVVPQLVGHWGDHSRPVRSGAAPPPSA